MNRYCEHTTTQLIGRLETLLDGIHNVRRFKGTMVLRDEGLMADLLDLVDEAGIRGADEDDDLMRDILQIKNMLTELGPTELSGEIAHEPLSQIKRFLLEMQGRLAMKVLRHGQEIEDPVMSIQPIEARLFRGPPQDHEPAVLPEVRRRKPISGSMF